MELGVCYYPEQWPAHGWFDDAKCMQEMGIRYVRVAEFAWSSIEPEPGRLEWAWLDKAVEILHAQGLKVVMGTPTATPPKWLVDAHPEILPVDASGAVRGFGSRRHYCFSSPEYLSQSERIVRLMAQRYGHHPAVVAWQLDNEYGCHDTVLSYSPWARQAFRQWLLERYGDINTLNQAWGTAFWSQTYRNFDEVDPPVGAVTEAHPAHRLDYRRFASAQVVAYNRMQAQIVRACSPGRPVLHNYMGFFTEFDHHAVSRDLDIATWDSYPLGFTQDRADLSEAERQLYLRTGHPDIPAFHHDLYRGMCGGRWWVMEQQPGPVNWAPFNPAPLDGMVRLWTWQAFAHGAQVVSYFRWRQARVAQEQMHSGLQRPDRSMDQGGLEVRQVSQELAGLREATELVGLVPVNDVALLFDYESHWMGDIAPHGQGYSVIHECFRAYSALRGLGLNVAIVPSGARLADYALVVLPAALHVSAALCHELHHTSAQIIVGPRVGSKTIHLSIEEPLPPGPLQGLLGVSVRQVESLPPGVVECAYFSNEQVQLQRWRERLVCDGADVEGRYADGQPAITRCGHARYVAGCLDTSGWSVVLARAAQDAGLPCEPLPQGLRVSRIGDLAVACNFSDTEYSWMPSKEGCIPLLGEHKLAPLDVSVWRVNPLT